MIPKTLSASSLLTSESCMERWKVENFWRTPQMDSEPANIGTACHYALEHFVKAVHFEGKFDWSARDELLAFYKLGYIETFGSADFDTDAFKDGEQMVERWYERNKDGLPHEVISCEVKENFKIKTSAGPIPFNFIWDRADYHGDGVYEIVDYKSIRMPVSAEDLKKKIQPRAYALAAQVKWPDAKRIWVTFDLLRHDPVGIVFTREDNVATYRYLQRAAERIIAIDEDKTEETLNEECKWCIKRTTCNTLQRANAGGTVHSLTTREIAQKKLEIDSQILALKYAQEELDKQLCLEAEKRDEFEWQMDGMEIKINSRPTRKPNSSAIARLIGPELAAKYGNMTMGNIDKLLKNEDIDDDLRAEIKDYITVSWSSPSAKVKAISDFEEK